MFDQNKTTAKVMSDGLGAVVVIQCCDDIKQAIKDDGCHDVLNLPVYPFEEGYYEVELLKWFEPCDGTDGDNIVAEYISHKKLESPFSEIEKCYTLIAELKASQEKAYHEGYQDCIVNSK